MTSSPVTGVVPFLLKVKNILSSELLPFYSERPSQDPFLQNIYRPTGNVLTHLAIAHVMLGTTVASLSWPTKQTNDYIVLSYKKIRTRRISTYCIERDHTCYCLNYQQILTEFSGKTTSLKHSSLKRNFFS